MDKKLFEALQTKTLTLATADGGVPAKIVEVTELANHSDADRECFSVLLAVEGEHEPEQGMLTLQSDEHGELAVFAVPVGQDDEGVHYEVIFN